MSTTPADVSVAPKPRRTRSTRAGTGNRGVASASRQRLSRWWLLTPVVVIAIALGTWAVGHRLTASGPGPDARLHEVRRRSFPIVLKEKGELKAHKSVDIKCEVEGRSTIIWLVPEGTTVAEGDLLVQLSSETIDQKIREKEVAVNTAQSTYETARDELKIQRNKNASDLAKARTELELATIDLKKWEKGDQVQQLRDAELELASARSKQEQAAEQYRVSQRMYEKNFVTAVELEQDELDMQEAEFRLEKAQLALAVLKEFTFAKERMQYESAVRDAAENLTRTEATALVAANKAQNTARRAEEKLELVTAELKKYQGQLAKTKIHAPQAGLVVYFADRYWNSRNRIDVGAEVRQNQQLLQLPDLSQMKLVIRVHEADAERIKVGLPAKIQVAGVYEDVADANAGGTRASGAQSVFDGTVTKIAALADTRNRWLNPELREFETEIMLSETTEGLKPGVTAEAEVYVDHLEDVLAVPVQSVYARAEHSYVFMGGDGRGPTYREVRLGASSASFVQIADGVSEGERVWMTIDDDMIALLPSVDEAERSGQRALEAARDALGRRRSDRKVAGARERSSVSPSANTPTSKPHTSSGSANGDRPMQPATSSPASAPAGAS